MFGLLPVIVVDADVLQQCGAQRLIVSIGAGENFQNSAVLRTQEDHCEVPVGTRRRVDCDLSQLEPATTQNIAISNVEETRLGSLLFPRSSFVSSRLAT